jgi:hypothetical protein
MLVACRHAGPAAHRDLSGTPVHCANARSKRASGLASVNAKAGASTIS